MHTYFFSVLAVVVVLLIVFSKIPFISRKVDRVTLIAVALGSLVTGVFFPFAITFILSESSLGMLIFKLTLFIILTIFVLMGISILSAGLLEKRLGFLGYFMKKTCKEEESWSLDKHIENNSQTAEELRQEIGELNGEQISEVQEDITEALNEHMQINEETEDINDDTTIEGEKSLDAEMTEASEIEGEEEIIYQDSYTEDGLSDKEIMHLLYNEKIVSEADDSAMTFSINEESAEEIIEEEKPEEVVVEEIIEEEKPEEVVVEEIIEEEKPEEVAAEETIEEEKIEEVVVEEIIEEEKPEEVAAEEIIEEEKPEEVAAEEIIEEEKPEEVVAEEIIEEEKLEEVAAEEIIEEEKLEEVVVEEIIEEEKPEEELVEEDGQNLVIEEQENDDKIDVEVKIEKAFEFMQNAQYFEAAEAFTEVINECDDDKVVIESVVVICSIYKTIGQIELAREILIAYKEEYGDQLDDNLLEEINKQLLD